MRICRDCSFEYQEDFKFCPDCGRSHESGETAQDRAALNSSLSAMVRSAEQDRLAEGLLKSGGSTGRAPDIESAYTAADVLIDHDPLFYRMARDG